MKKLTLWALGLASFLSGSHVNLKAQESRSTVNCVREIEREESLVDIFTKKPIRYEASLLKKLPDPLFLHTKDERINHIANLRSILLANIENDFGAEIMDVLSKSNVVYCDGKEAVDHQLKEFQRDALYYKRDSSLKAQMGLFQGSLEEFNSQYKTLEKTDNFLSNLLYDTRNLVPFSANTVGKKEIFPVYCFPLWLDEFKANQRGAQNAKERNILMLSDLGHEYAHILFNYDGFNLVGRKITEDNFSKTFGFPESFCPGMLRIISELYATRYGHEMLAEFPHLQKANNLYFRNTRDNFKRFSGNYRAARFLDKLL